MPDIVHTVRQGETLSNIARKYGFENFEPIWNYSQNDSLRRRRDNPHALLPGDEISIPEKKLRKFDAVTNAEHRFQVVLPKILLRICALDTGGQALTNANATLTYLGNSVELTTDATGMIECEVPADLLDASLVVGNFTFPLAVGHLDPIDERSGQQARLKGLGYFGDPVQEQQDLTDDSELVGDEAFELAMELFQFDHQLPVDGEIDAADIDALETAFGC